MEESTYFQYMRTHRLHTSQRQIHFGGVKLGFSAVEAVLFGRTRYVVSSYLLQCNLYHQEFRIRRRRIDLGAWTPPDSALYACLQRLLHKSLAQLTTLSSAERRQNSRTMTQRLFSLRRLLGRRSQQEQPRQTYEQLTIHLSLSTPRHKRRLSHPIHLQDKHFVRQRLQPCTKISNLTSQPHQLLSLAK